MGSRGIRFSASAYLDAVEALGLTRQREAELLDVEVRQVYRIRAKAKNGEFLTVDPWKAEKLTRDLGLEPLSSNGRGSKAGQDGDAPSTGSRLEALAETLADTMEEQAHCRDAYASLRDDLLGLTRRVDALEAQRVIAQAAPKRPRGGEAR